MTDYPYGMQLAVAPLDENNVIRNGEVFIYNTSDLDGVSPLTLTDLSGLPLVNPLRSNTLGFLRPFITNAPQVKWKSGIYEGLFDSFIGMRDVSLAAQVAAEAASSAATGAAVDAGTEAAAAVTAQLAASATATAASATAASTSATSATAANAAAAAAQSAAEAAASASAGGGYAISPSDPDVLIISTKADGTVAISGADSDVLTITT